MLNPNAVLAAYHRHVELAREEGIEHEEVHYIATERVKEDALRETGQMLDRMYWSRQDQINKAHFAA